ncbi:MAG: DMT family transporter [Bacteroides sp.]
MTGFLIAMISGALMSVQGVFNTDVTKSSSIWVAGGFVQLTALLTCIVMWFISGRPEIAGIFHVERKYALLGGVIGAFITYTVVRSMSSLGTAKASLTIVITQVAAAYLIELFGLFGSEKSDFSWMKFLGLIVSIAGLVIFNMCAQKQ